MKATIVAIFLLAAVTCSMGESWGNPPPCDTAPAQFIGLVTPTANADADTDAAKHGNGRPKSCALKHKSRAGTPCPFPEGATGAPSRNQQPTRSPLPRGSNGN
uniref:Putative secreted protein n=1 Tax=Ixodes ricinus TaxID=34613 RepID=A0A6B0UGS3_IXORI